MSRIFPFGSRRRSRLRSEKLGFLRSPLVSASFPLMIYSMLRETFHDKYQGFFTLYISRSLRCLAHAPAQGSKARRGYLSRPKKNSIFFGGDFPNEGVGVVAKFFREGRKPRRDWQEVSTESHSRRGWGCGKLFSGAALCSPLSLDGSATIAQNPRNSRYERVRDSRRRMSRLILLAFLAPFSRQSRRRRG